MEEGLTLNSNTAQRPLSEPEAHMHRGYIHTLTENMHVQRMYTCIENEHRHVQRTHIHTESTHTCRKSRCIYREHTHINREHIRLVRGLSD